MARWDRTCPILADFSPHTAPEICGGSDAATTEGDGCGGWLLVKGEQKARGFMRAWRAEDRARAFIADRESTTVLEADALFELLTHFQALVAGRRVQIQVDNSSLVWALQGLYSDKTAVMAAIERIALLCSKLHILLRVRWVNGTLFNRIADALSHLDATQAEEACLASLGVPLACRR
jgi:hypothetical protein